MKIKNQIKKGTVLKINYTDNDVFVLISPSGANLDISDKLSSQDKTNIKHLKSSLAIVKDDENIEVCSYVQFHTHTEYSTLDGLSNLKELARESSGVTAITDHANMFGMVKWQNAMKKEGKKALFGCEVYVENIDGEKENNHLLLIAKDEEGKKNLFKLTSNAYYNFYKKPHVSLEELKKYSSGIICTSACIGGNIPKALLSEGYDKAKSIAMFYKELFGDDFYIEIQRHNIAEESIVNKQLIKLSKELNVKIVAGNDSHYVKSSDADAHEILLLVNQDKTIDEPHWKFEGDGYHYMSDSEMINLFWDIPEAITNTYEIAEKCNLVIETGVYHLPKFDVPEGFKNEEEYLIHLTDIGYDIRFKGTDMYDNEEYRQRLEFEKQIIMSMGFASYFLIVQDYVNWAKNNGIMVGAGRGSGAGSLVCYCLKITDLNPIEFGLLFERFLNPDRISMPDIDMDFEDTRREEVINYLKTKYGNDNVCKIITYNTLQLKSAVNDVAKSLNEKPLGKTISSYLTDDMTSITEALNKSAELNALYENNQNARKLIDLVKRIEGTTKTTGVHACGVLVADKPIYNYMPTALVSTASSSDKVLVTQVTEVEDLGLLKMDILSLKTMTVIGETLRYVNSYRENNGLKKISYYRDITLYNPYVYADIGEGKSFAVFQIESEGMRKFMVDLFSDVKEKISLIEEKYQLSGFEDTINGSGCNIQEYSNEMTSFGKELFERMIAGVSLYRPGPMEYIPDYIKGMRNPNSIHYDLPQLKPILSNTYGVITYQEQVMVIVRELAGFSKGDADTVRKGMGKKKQDIIDEYGEYFVNGCAEKHIKGCVANGIDEELARSIWEKMRKFGEYAFNKSHAGVYSILTIVCAWLKYYYPHYYMCAIMNSYIEDKKLSGYINVAKSMGIKLLPPSINKSYEGFTIEGKDIRYGIKGLTNISKMVTDLITERKSGGDYTGYLDFVYRNISIINKRALVSLINSGALDGFGFNRNSMFNSIDKVLKQARKDKKDADSGQISIFDLTPTQSLDIDIPILPEYSNLDLINKEKETAGLYISNHPLDFYEKEISNVNPTNLCFVVDGDDESSLVNCHITTVGIIKNTKILFTKKDNRAMASFKLEDCTDDITCVVFPDDYEAMSSNISNDNIVVVSGQVKSSDFGLQLIVHSIASINEYATNDAVEKVYVKLSNTDLISELKNYLSVYTGNIPVYVQVDNKLYDIKIFVNPTANLFMNLQNDYGTDNVLYR